MSESGSLLKIGVIGNCAVGKTSLLLQFVNQTFSEGYSVTIGADFLTKTVQLEGKTVDLEIRDTAGQERFRSISSSYFRDLDGVIIVYDVTDQSSFDSIGYWLENAKSHIENTVFAILIVGNKIDASEKVVDYNTGKELTDKLGAQFIQTSARDATNVDQAFNLLASEIISKK